MENSSDAIGNRVYARYTSKTQIVSFQKDAHATIKARGEIQIPWGICTFIIERPFPLNLNEQ